MSASVKLALGELANTSYLTVKNLVPGAGSFTVSTESFKGSITIPVGVTLVAYVRNAKVVSKVVTAAASDAGKDLLSLAQDLAAYLQSLQPVPQDISGLSAELARVSARVQALEAAPGGGVSEEQVKRIINGMFLVLGPSDPIPPGTKPGTIVIRETP